MLDIGRVTAVQPGGPVAVQAVPERAPMSTPPSSANPPFAKTATPSVPALTRPFTAPGTAPATPSPATQSPPPATDAPMGLFGGLLDRFAEIVGDAPSYATFHYASQQEGVRLAAGAAARDVPVLLQRVDSILGQQSTLGVAGPDAVHIDVRGSALVRSRVGLGIVLGLIEGVLKVAYKRNFEGRIEGNPTPDGVARLRFDGRPL